MKSPSAPTPLEERTHLPVEALGFLIFIAVATLAAVWEKYQLIGVLALVATLAVAVGNFLAAGPLGFLVVPAAVLIGGCSAMAIHALLEFTVRRNSSEAALREALESNRALAQALHQERHQHGADDDGPEDDVAVA